MSEFKNIEVVENVEIERRVAASAKGQGLEVKELLLIGILLAAGAVLKIFSNTLIAGVPLKPNFIRFAEPKMPNI